MFWVCVNFIRTPYHQHLPRPTNNAPDYTSGWINPIASQTLNGGWTSDAPAQVTQYSYSTPHYGAQAKSDQ